MGADLGGASALSVLSTEDIKNFLRAVARLLRLLELLGSRLGALLRDMKALAEQVEGDE